MNDLIRGLEETAVGSTVEGRNPLRGCAAPTSSFRPLPARPLQPGRTVLNPGPLKVLQAPEMNMRPKSMQSAS